jgi:hypothetical protein
LRANLFPFRAVYGSAAPPQPGSPVVEAVAVLVTVVVAVPVGGRVFSRVAVVTVVERAVDVALRVASGPAVRVVVREAMVVTVTVFVGTPDRRQEQALLMWLGDQLANSVGLPGHIQSIPGPHRLMGAATVTRVVVVVVAVLVRFGSVDVRVVVKVRVTVLRPS